MIMTSVIKELRRSSLVTLQKCVLTCHKAELASFFFLSGFFFTNIMNQRAVEEGVDYFFNSSLPLSPAIETFRHSPGYWCRELTSAHSWQPGSNQKPLVSYWKLLSTKLSYPLKCAPSTLTMITDVVRSMLKTWATLRDIFLVLLNLIKRFIFVVFKLLPPMFTQLTFIFSL